MPVGPAGGGPAAELPLGGPHGGNALIRISFDSVVHLHGPVAQAPVFPPDGDDGSVAEVQDGSVKTSVSFASIVVALASAVTAVLAGCSAPRSEPNGPTAEELKAYGQFVLDRQWDSLELPRSIHRPTITPKRYVDSENFSSVTYNCVNDIARHGYRPLLTYRDAVRVKKTGDGDFLDALAWYECTARFPVELDALGLRSDEQLTVIYDHFQRWVIPCLATHGYVVTGAPSRAKFLEDGEGFWSPLEDLYRTGYLSETDYLELREACDVYPARMFPGASY